MNRTRLLEKRGRTEARSGTKRKYLFFTNTPAHVHLYKHPVRELRARGHDVFVLGRDYGCTKELLDFYDLPYELYGECDTNKHSLFGQLPRHFLRILRHVRRYDPDLVCGIGAYAAFAGMIARVPVFVIHDSEPTTLDHLVSHPFVDAFLTPYTFRKSLGRKHYEFDGFKELAYLHPEVFEPQVDVRDKLDLGPDEPFAILRFNAFGSHHDINHSGFTLEQRRELAASLGEAATVFVSDEGGRMDFDRTEARPFDLHPALLHDALAEADLLVADSQTMVTEAALLGTPAIRSNSFIGDSDMGNFIELEEHGLIHNVAEFEQVLATSREMLADDSIQKRWTRKRDEFLSDKVDLSELIVDVLTNHDSLDQVTGISKKRRESKTGFPAP